MHHHEAAPAQVACVGSANGQRKANAHGSVHGVATGFQNIEFGCARPALCSVATMPLLATTGGTRPCRSHTRRWRLRQRMSVAPQQARWTLVAGRTAGRKVGQASARLADSRVCRMFRGFASLKNRWHKCRPSAGLWRVCTPGPWHETGFSTGCGCTETVYTLPSAHGGHCTTLMPANHLRGDTEIPGLSTHVLDTMHVRCPAAGMAVRL